MHWNMCVSLKLEGSGNRIEKSIQRYGVFNSME